MSEWTVHQTLVAAFQALGIPQAKVAYENQPFTPPADGSMWYGITNLPASRDPLTLGDDGDDRYVGVFQIDIYGPQGEGVKAVLQAASAMTANYSAGTKFTHSGQAVLVRKSEISQPRRDGVRLVVSVSVYWSASIPR